MATKSTKKGAHGGATRRWVAKVTTDFTHRPRGLFTQDAETIAKTLASKPVSPKGPSSGMRMLTYFINREGKQLSASRRADLEKAKHLLSGRIQQAAPQPNDSSSHRHRERSNS